MVNIFYRCAFFSLLPKSECSVSCFRIYVPVISLPKTEQSTELGRISESFSHVTADSKCCFMNTNFTEKVI
jgi:hypothetical protein